MFTHVLLSLFTYKQVYLLVSNTTSALFLWFYMTDYRLHNDRLIPTNRILSLLLVETGPDAHTASCSVGTGDSFPGCTVSEEQN